MANFNGVNVTKTGARPVTLIDSGEWHGRMRVMYDSYEAVGEAIASTLTMAILPKGARIYSMKLMFDALGTASTISVGVSGSAAKFIAATATATAGKTEVMKIAEVGAELAAETTVLLTTGGGTITGTVKLVVTYTMQ